MSDKSLFAKTLIESIEAMDGEPIRCIYCEKNIDDSPTLDHIHATNSGGEDELENAVLACDDCNSSKGDRPLHKWLARRSASLERERIRDRMSWLRKDHGIPIPRDVGFSTYMAERQAIRKKKFAQLF